MKINRAVAVPVGALTQRSGQDLKNQIAKISSLFDCKGLISYIAKDTQISLNITDSILNLFKKSLKFEW